MSDFETSKGKWFKTSDGFVGRCFWAGYSKVGSPRAVARLGLTDKPVARPANQTEPQPRWVDFAAVAECDPPAEYVAAQAARRAAPAFDGHKGHTALVVRGEHTGAVGTCIWVGVKDGVTRIGIKIAAHGHAAIWLDAGDAVRIMPRFANDKAKLQTLVFEARERRMVALMEADLDAEAAGEETKAAYVVADV